MSHQESTDLNRIQIVGPGEAVQIDDGPIPLDQVDEYMARITDSDIPGSPSDTVPATHLVEVTFSPKQALRHFIWQADAIVGCVAWLTDPDVLAELARKESVSIVVQKEDFLRPDAQSGGGWKRDLRRRYDALPGGLHLTDETFMGGITHDRGWTHGDPEIRPVRCCGLARNSQLAKPNMHHKFMVALKRSTCPDPPGSRPLYYAESVFTGSFNPTKNGSRSLENAVIIRGGMDIHRLGHPDARSAEGRADWERIRTACVPYAFLVEWEHVLALSEPLDWTQDWIAPEWSLD